MNRAVVALGSNIDPEANVERALAELRRRYSVEATSPFVYTAPIGFPGQPDFLNGAVRLATERDHPTLRTELKGIEDELGRDRTAPRFGPRTMDLDVVVFNGRVVDSDVHERAFLRDAIAAVWPWGLDTALDTGRTARPRACSRY